MTSLSTLNFKKDSPYGYLYMDIVRRGVGNRKIELTKDFDRATLLEGHADKPGQEDEG
jgi:hypothetical protein